MVETPVNRFAVFSIANSGGQSIVEGDYATREEANAKRAELAAGNRSRRYTVHVVTAIARATEPGA